MTYGARPTYMLVKGKGETPFGRAEWSRLTYDAFAAEEHDFASANLLRGKDWKGGLGGVDGEEGVRGSQ